MYDVRHRTQTAHHRVPKKADASDNWRQACRHGEAPATAYLNVIAMRRPETSETFSSRKWLDLERPHKRPITIQPGCMVIIPARQVWGRRTVVVEFSTRQWRDSTLVELRDNHRRRLNQHDHGATMNCNPGQRSPHQRPIVA